MTETVSSADVQAPDYVVAFEAADLDAMYEVSRPGLTRGGRAGIGAAVASVVVITIAFFIFLARRRGAKPKPSKHTEQIDQSSYTKAELSAEAKPTTELDEQAAVHEKDSVVRPIEAINANGRYELESDWTGWEAPTRPGAEPSAPQGPHRVSPGPR